MNLKVRFVKPPSIIGTDKLSNAVIKHFKFIKYEHLPKIDFLIREISQLIGSDYNIYRSEGIRFQIGEIVYYPKNGNLHIIVLDNLIPDIWRVIEKNFDRASIEYQKQYKEDNENTIIIDFEVDDYIKRESNISLQNEGDKPNNFNLEEDF